MEKLLRLLQKVLGMLDNVWRPCLDCWRKRRESVWIAGESKEKALGLLEKALRLQERALGQRWHC